MTEVTTQETTENVAPEETTATEVTATETSSAAADQRALDILTGKIDPNAPVETPTETPQNEEKPPVETAEAKDDTTPEEEVKEEEKVETLTKSEYYEKLTAKDKEIRTLREQVKQSQQQPSLDQIKQVFRNDLKGALEYFGVNNDVLMDHLLSADTPATAETQEKETPKSVDPARLREEILSEVQQQFAAQQQQLKVQQHLTEIQSVVSKNAETFELINTNKAHDLVLQTQADWYQQNNGEYLPIEKAAELVENYLYEEQMKQIEKFRGLNKMKDLFAQQQAAPTPAPAQVKPAAAPSPTLGNGLTPADTPAGELTEEEKEARLLKILTGEVDVGGPQI
jgi:hypothetical protein